MALQSASTARWAEGRAISVGGRRLRTSSLYKLSLHRLISVEGLAGREAYSLSFNLSRAASFFCPSRSKLIQGEVLLRVR